MEKIHIYAINYSPCIPNSDDSIKKSSTVDCVIRQYKENTDEHVEIGAIEMFTYRPKNDKGYMNYVEEFVYEETSKPCILIFKSIFDISADASSASVRLMKYLREDFIKSVYFSDYSTETDARSYLNELLNGLQKTKSSSTRTGKIHFVPDKLWIEIESLRRLSGLKLPVNFTDLKKATGIPKSTIKSHFTHTGSSNRTRSEQNGRSITEAEIARLQEVMSEQRSEYINNVEIFYETYIKSK